MFDEELPKLRGVGECRSTPLVLMILDGWGATNPRGDFNAEAIARTPNLDRLAGEYPTFTLETSGEVVGLPEGQMGNSEVGHGTIGAGRVVYQPLVRISKAIESGEFARNEEIVRTMDHVKWFFSSGATLHLFGLLSDGGIHSHIDHLFALIDTANEQGVKNLVVHALTDGRDTDPKCAERYVMALERKLKEAGIGVIGSVGGRHWGMDRDRRWDRTEKGMAPMFRGEGLKASSSVEALGEGYARGEGDETLTPTVIVNDRGDPVGGTLKRDDALILFNFRDDRMRQPIEMLVRSGIPLHIVTMTKYEVPYEFPVVFPPVSIEETLGEVLSNRGLRVLRLAETEKFPHVTFFFDNGKKTPPQTTSIMCPSTRQVPTYDFAPRMSADEIADSAETAVKSGEYDVIVMNLANGDMVGHTGKLGATVKAAEAVDEAVGRVTKAVKEAGGTLLIIADHGNCEQMIDYFDENRGSPHTQHTAGIVPGILVSDRLKRMSLSHSEGGLADVAPTMLELMEIPKPPQMTGKSMIKLKA